MATANLYYDSRRLKDDGTAQIKIAINHKGRSAYMPTGICVAPSQWRKDKMMVVSHPAKDTYNNHLSALLLRTRNAMLELTTKYGSLVRCIDAKQLREEIDKMLNPQSEEEHTFTTFGDAFRSFIERHENARTRELYEATLIKIREFNQDLLDARFEDITKNVLESFFAWMAKDSPSVNARNIHMRNIRAVFNDAIDNDITNNYPFRRLKIRPVQTAKRNLSPEQMARIFFGEYEQWQQRYVDAFHLSFLLIGINMVDMLNLTKDSLQGGRIVYNRAKTKRLYSIKIEPEAYDIIRRYPGKDRLLSFAEKNRSYKTFSMKMNDCLGRIMHGVTAYYARHTWATIASSLDIPKDTIAAALGHGGHSVTDIYIDFDRTKIDRANRLVIDAVYSAK